MSAQPAADPNSVNSGESISDGWQEAIAATIAAPQRIASGAQSPAGPAANTGTGINTGGIPSPQYSPRSFQPIYGMNVPQMGAAGGIVSTNVSGMAPAVPLNATPAQLQAQGVSDPFQAMYDPWRQQQMAPWGQYQRVTPVTVDGPSAAAQAPAGVAPAPAQSAPPISIEPERTPPPVHFPSNTQSQTQQSVPFQMSPEFMAQFMMMNQMMQMRPPMPMPQTVSGQILQEHANKQEPSVPSASAQIPQQQFQTLVGPS